MKETMRVIDQKIAAERKTAQKHGGRITAASFAQRMHLDPSLFSRWRASGDNGVNRETMTSMQIGFSDDRYEQAELLAAILKDHRHGPAADLVDVVVRRAGGKSVKESAPSYGSDQYAQLAECARETMLDSKGVDAICTLIKALDSNPSLRKVLFGLVKMST